MKFGEFFWKESSDGLDFSDLFLNFKGRDLHGVSVCPDISSGM